MRKSAGGGQTGVPGPFCSFGAAAFMNAGTVDVQTGTLVIQGLETTRTHTGVFQVAASAALNFTGGGQAFNPGSAFSGPDTVFFRTAITLGTNLNFGALQVDFRDSASVSGAFILANTPGGTMTFNKTMTVPGCVDIGGVMTVGSASHTVTINCKLALQSGATLNNPGIVRVGRFDNFGGSVSGSAPVLLGTSLQITPASATVGAGQGQTFTPSGGTPVYTFSLSANPSGGSITTGGAYTAGPTPNVTDTILVTDGQGCTAKATAAVVSQPEIAVQHPAGTDLLDGVSSVNWGVVGFGASSNKTFIITNTGTADLTGLAVTLDGVDAARFSVSSPGSTTVAPGASTTFAVTYSPSGGSLFSAALHIASNDEDENPFDINLTGTVPPRDANLAYEPFLIGANPAAGEYGAGNLSGQNPLVPGWTGLWQSSFGGLPVASAPGLTYADLAVSGGSISVASPQRTGRLLAQPYGHGFSGVVYLRFLLHMHSSVPSAYRAFELHDGGFDDALHRVLHLGQSSSGNFDFRLFSDNSLQAFLGAVTTGPDLFVIKFSFSTAPNGDSVTVWRNPDPTLLGLADPPGGVTFSGFDMHFDRTSITHTLGGANFDFEKGSVPKRGQSRQLVSWSIPNFFDRCVGVCA